jgi:formylglycine-generating enzyme required for sulfatase activity
VVHRVPATTSATSQDLYWISVIIPSGVRDRRKGLGDASAIKRRLILPEQFAPHHGDRQRPAGAWAAAGWGGRGSGWRWTNNYDRNGNVIGTLYYNNGTYDSLARIGNRRQWLIQPVRPVTTAPEAFSPVTSLHRVCLFIMLPMLKNVLPLRRCRWNPADAILIVSALWMTGFSAFCEEPSDKQPAYPLWDGSESVADYAKKVNLSPTKTLDLGNGVNMELVLIPAGKFIMGTPEPIPVDEDGFHKRILTGQALFAVSGGLLLVLLGVVVIRAIRRKRRPQLSLGLLLLVTVAAGGAVLSGVHWRQSAWGLGQAKVEYQAAQARCQAAAKSEKPAHPVTLTKPFYMGKYAVTQEQYQAVVGTNPSNFKGKDNLVEQVSWDDAQAFCKKLTEQSKQAMRLPTEAEWEFACRAGTMTDYYSGDTEADLAREAWYEANSKKTTHPVGQKEPNVFGLFDMHGNIWQWCQDWYAEDYYGKSPATDPEGPAQGAFRLLRGGSWGLNPVICLAALRYWGNPGNRGSGVGFRVASPASSPP